jgi:oxygen-dependent protoporphyrinogen oxidase
MTGGDGLIRGLRRQKAASTADPAAPVFHGLTGGTQVLTDALAAALPAKSVRTGVPVTSLAPAAGGYRLEAGGETVETDAVVLAVPSWSAAPLVAPFAPELASGLASVEWSSVVLVTFVVPASAVAHPLDGSGFLVPEGEGLLMTACTFGSSKWAHWDPGGGNVVLRVSAGRHHDRRATGLDDGTLVAHLLDDLRLTIGLEGDPVATRLSRWDDALPQYLPGHLDRARRWKDEAPPGLYLTGASYLGLGLPACITDAEATASAVVTARS